MNEPKTVVKKLSSGVWTFDQEMVRCFLIVGSKRALLFDTGAMPCPLDEMIREITDLPLTVVHSHGDGDHTANDQYFSDIYAHPLEFDIIRASRPGLKAKLHPVTEMSSFDLGDRLIKIIEAPGHTPGSICLLDVANRILFSGDTLSYGPVFLFGSNRDINAYRATLDKLMAMGSFDTIYPCHNTCPVSLSVITALMSAVDGMLNDTIPPVVPEMVPPGCDNVRQYNYGKCGILYEK